jgi:hypothetical protein
LPNTLGTKTNLTGIPSLLISTLQQVTDQNIQKALYQIQNWANSFFPWNYGGISGSYTTGGFAFNFPSPYSTSLFSIVVTPASSGASQAQIISATKTGAVVALYNSVGAQLPNGTAFAFFYMAIGS